MSSGSSGELQQEPPVHVQWLTGTMAAIAALLQRKGFHVNTFKGFQDYMVVSGGKCRIITVPETRNDHTPVITKIFDRTTTSKLALIGKSHLTNAPVTVSVA